MYKLPKGMQKIMDELNSRPHDGMHYKQILEAVGTTNAHYALKNLEERGHVGDALVYKSFRVKRI